MIPKSKYVVGEKILCFHGPLLYEARCIDIDEKGAEVRYLVHYQGWNKTWDEWISDSRILKFNEAGLKKQKELQEEARKKKSKRKLAPGGAGGPGGCSVEKRRSSRPGGQQRHGEAGETCSRSVYEGEECRVGAEGEDCKAGVSVVSEEGEEERGMVSRSLRNTGGSNDGSVSAKGEGELGGSAATGGELCLSSKSTNSSKSKKSRLVPLDDSVCDLEAYASGINVPSLKFTFTDKLRMWLADDWDLITRQSRLSRIPTRLTVDSVLNQYCEYCEELQLDDGENEFEFHKNREMRLELIEGLRKYFNMSVGSVLLYKFERQQYFDIITKNSNKTTAPGGGGDMSSVYGSIFVLRLLVNMQKLISYTRTDPKSVDCLSELIQHFVEFLDANADDIFQLEDYITATGDYIRRAMC